MVPLKKVENRENCYLPSIKKAPNLKKSIGQALDITKFIKLEGGVSSMANLLFCRLAIVGGFNLTPLAKKILTMAKTLA